jgi:uncharacterized protein (DUF427 family)
MSLMIGSGPFGQRPAGSFNFARPSSEVVLYLEDSPRRMRATLEGVTVVDSVRAKLLHQSGRLPVHCFAADDVRMDLLAPSGRIETSPGRGDAEWLDAAVGDRRVEGAGWRWVRADPAAPRLEGLVTLRWGAMDSWWEEDEEVFVHVRDPYHRVDVLPSSRRVVVRLAGETMAESSAARVLFETSAPPRWYLPPKDVRQERLIPMDLVTRCAYKGRARFWAVEAGGRRHDAVVWSYPEPNSAVAPIAGRLAFFVEQAEHEIDGVVQPTPASPWSSPDWWRPAAAGPPGISRP